MDEHILSIVLLFGPTAAELLSPQLENMYKLESNRESRAIKPKQSFYIL